MQTYKIVQTTQLRGLCDGHARRGMDLQLSVSGAAETSQAEATPAPSSAGADEENGSYGGYRYYILYERCQVDNCSTPCGPPSA